MNGDEAFLSDVLVEPDDDVPRLIYADWLQARNEVRSEFIRQQCLVATLSPHDPQRHLWQAKSQQLERQFDKVWSAPLRGKVQSVRFERGFVHHVGIDAGKFLRWRHKLFQLAPIRSMLLNVSDQVSLDAVAQCLELRHLRAIGFASAGGMPSLGRFLQSEHLKRLESLSLGHGAPSLESLDALASVTSISHLRHLDIRQSLLEAPVIGEILGYPLFERLESLRMGPIPLSDRPYPIALELSPILNRLRSLEMAMCQLDAADLRELFHYCTSPLTSCLRLQRNPLGWQGVRALQEAPFLQAITELDLSSCQLNSRAMSALGQLRLARLRTLRLNHNLIDHRGARELAQADVLSSVYELSLQGMRDQSGRGQFKLGDAGFSALVGNGLRSLRVLDAARNELRAASLASLLAAPDLDQLVSIDLSDNLIDDLAARQLIDQGPWRDLVQLKLTNNPISDSMRQVLQTEFGARVIF